MGFLVCQTVLNVAAAVGFWTVQSEGIIWWVAVGNVGMVVMAVGFAVFTVRDWGINLGVFTFISFDASGNKSNDMVAHSKRPNQLPKRPTKRLPSIFQRSPPQPKIILSPKIHPNTLENQPQQHHHSIRLLRQLILQLLLI